MQHMVVCLRTHFKRDQLMIRRPFIRLTPRNKIWPRPSHGILYEIGDEEREDKAYEPAEDCDVCFMAAWLKN